MNSDKAFFKKNRDRNARLRRPAPGEVEEIMRRSLPGAAYEIAVMGGKLQSPPETESEWAVLVVNIAPDTMLRLVAIQPKDKTDEGIPGAFSGAAITFDKNVVIDRLRA